jgi:hypothetical protein
MRVPLNSLRFIQSQFSAAAKFIRITSKRFFRITVPSKYLKRKGSSINPSIKDYGTVRNLKSFQAEDALFSDECSAS